MTWMKSLCKQSKNCSVNPGFSCEKKKRLFWCEKHGEKHEVELVWQNKQTNKKLISTELYFSQNVPKQYFTNQEFPQSENGAYRHMTHMGGQLRNLNRQWSENLVFQPGDLLTTERPFYTSAKKAYQKIGKKTYCKRISQKLFEILLRKGRWIDEGEGNSRMAAK